jgi:hypothetical protein
MKIIITIMAVIALAGPAQASSELIEFIGGVAAAYVLHEGGHALAAELTAADIRWTWGNHNQFIGFEEREALGKRSGAALYGAGLVAQMLSSEVILGCDRIEKNSSFVRGMMAWNIINPLKYAADYWITRSHGDLYGMAHYAGRGRANVFAAAMTAVTINQGYRFLRTQTWAPEWTKRPGNAFYAGPAMGGIGLQISFSFNL